MFFSNWTARISVLLFVLGASFSLTAQSSINGTITDQKGVPLVGANVYAPEVQLGAVTDENGFFDLGQRASAATRLEVSYVGYRTQVVDLQPGQESRLALVLEENPVFTGEVVVSATRADDRTPMTFSTVDRELIQQNNVGQDVPFILRWTPSAVVTSDAGTGIGYTGIWIRGSDPTRINVTINGIPVNDAESQGVFWVNLPDFASSAEDIQVQRGVGASTNGSGAFGATINLNTSKVNRDAYASTDMTVGSFGTLKGNLRFGTGLLKNGFTIDGRLSRITSDGYIDRASVDLSSWYLSGAWVGDKSSVRLTAFDGNEVTYQAWNGVDASLVDDPDLRTTNTAGTEKEGEPYDNEVDDYGQTYLQLFFNHEFNRNWNANLAGHWTIGGGFFEQYKAGEDFADYGLTPITIGQETINTTDLIRRRWLDNDYYGGTYGLNYNSDDSRFRATLGGGYHIYQGAHFGEIIWARFASQSEIRDRYYDNDAEKIDFNIFTKFNYALTDRWDAYLDLQLRTVDYTFLGIDNTGNTVDQTADLQFFNPKAGIQYRADNNQRAYASIAVAQREPNRNDFVGSTPENRPRAEKLYNLEAGWEKQWSKATVQANFYYMYYEDQLVLNGQIDDVGALLRTNVDESYRTGIELVAGGEILDNLTLQGNFTLSRNRVVSFTEFVDDYDADFNWIGQQAVKREETDLAFSPNVLGAAELRYDFLPSAEKHDLSLALRGKYVGRRYLDNSSDEANSLDPYFFSDWQLQYTIRPGGLRAIRLNFQVLNWMDELYESNGWSYRYFFDGEPTLLQGLYPQAGRQLMLGIGIDF
ncbi:MAG: TonB-dependent receptor [Bacteroidota bacterium]